jgi:ATP:corrinoid adenosyltransferase
MLLKERQISSLKSVILDEINEKVRNNFKTKTTGPEFEALLKAKEDDKEVKEMIDSLKKDEEKAIELFELREKVKSLNKNYNICWSDDDYKEFVYIEGDSIEEIKELYAVRIKNRVDSEVKRLVIDELKVANYIDWAEKDKLNNIIEAILNTLENAPYETLKEIVYEKLGNIDYLFVAE